MNHGYSSLPLSRRSLWSLRFQKPRADISCDIRVKRIDKPNLIEVQSHELVSTGFGNLKMIYQQQRVINFDYLFWIYETIWKKDKRSQNCKFWWNRSLSIKIKCHSSITIISESYQTCINKSAYLLEIVLVFVSPRQIWIKSKGASRIFRAGQGREGKGRAGQGRAGQGTAGHGRSLQGTAGHRNAGRGRGYDSWSRALWVILEIVKANLLL